MSKLSAFQVRLPKSQAMALLRGHQGFEDKFLRYPFLCFIMDNFDLCTFGWSYPFEGRRDFFWRFQLMTNKLKRLLNILFCFVFFNAFLNHSRQYIFLMSHFQFKSRNKFTEGQRAISRTSEQKRTKRGRNSGE